MKRRELLTGFVAGSAFTAVNGYLWDMVGDSSSDSGPLANLDPKTLQPAEPDSDGEGQTAGAQLDKVRNFENEFADDTYLATAQLPLLHSVLARLKRAEKVVGHGNYNILSFDELLTLSRRYSRVGEFTRRELDFIEQVFDTKATSYGFMGDKVSTQLTEAIAKRDTYKVPYTGHFLFKGESTAYYDKLKKDVGKKIILTSGIRSNVKQLHLFMAKTVASEGNLSKASRSLAPPGHSYHGIGDFDVGKVGWGLDNFSDKFAKTDEFKRMQDLGYVQIRYTRDNRLGVRFEPWHIKVV